MTSSEDLPTTTTPWELKKLSPAHKQAAALLAQGLGRPLIAAACDFSPEYVTYLARQPLFVQYLREMTAAAQVRLDALFDQSVDVIADTLVNGGVEEKLKAARLQMEATGRVGRLQGTERPAQEGPDRLEQLAERLVSLLHKQRQRTFTSDGMEIVDA